MTRVESFAPLAPAAGRARVLVLGSMPGAESLRQGRYYAHPQNAFWWIMGELFGAGPELAYAERARRLCSAQVAVWDVLRSCERPGSLDAAIRAEEPNDLAGLLTRQPNLRAIWFNGQKAARAFERHLAAPLARAGLWSRPVRVLPSTSPAHANLSRAQKLAAWRAAARSLARAR